MQEQELFNNYEVKNWEFSPRIYKILSISAIFNIVAILVFAQSNLLTIKGCDSPLVGKVCSVLDALVVGGTVLSTNAEYVNDPYNPTELTENDEVIWIPVGDKLAYPEGYFALSNPELAAMQNPDGSLNYGSLNNGTIPGIPNPTTGGGSNLLNNPQVLPPTTGDVIDGNLPSPNGNNPTTTPYKPYKPYKPKPVKSPKIKQNSPNTLPTLPTDPTTTTAQTDNKTENKTTENQTPLKSETPKGVEINKKPLKDFAATVKVKYEKKEVDLSQNFTVVADGVLTKDGKLDVSIDQKTKKPKSQITKTEGNAEMIEVAKQAIQALGDSGWLLYLRNEGVEKINFTISQDNDNLIVKITSDQPTKERASTVSSKLNGAIQGALLLNNNGVVKLGDDEKTLLSNARVTSEANQFILNMILPKPVALEMITRKLNEPEKTETKPNSTAQIVDKTQTSGK